MMKYLDRLLKFTQQRIILKIFPECDDGDIWQDTVLDIMLGAFQEIRCFSLISYLSSGFSFF
jgi:hypothetical protein